MDGPCKNCDGRGFVFIQKNPEQRWQVTCPVCNGENLVAKEMERVLTGEELDPNSYEGKMLELFRKAQKLIISPTDGAKMEKG